MLTLGQHNYTFLDAELPARLGGHSDLPPNLAPATEQDFWRVVSLGLWRIFDRQPRVRYTEWVASYEIKPHDKDDAGVVLPNVKLFTRHDLSGVMVVLTHHHARNEYPHDDAIWGRYEPRFWTFAACRHMTTTSKSDAYSSFVERKCEVCGFWTKIDSSD